MQAMSDEDIKKALECCVSTDDCKKCPLGGTHQCYPTLEKNALDLIYRQQAEIERLNGNLFTISNACMQRRNEAIKEFAAKLKCGVSITSGVITCADIDDLLAKMAGEQNA